MSYEIKVSSDQASFIESYTMVTDLNMEVYFIPYWFEKKASLVYTPHNLDALPDSIKAIIIANRDGCVAVEEKKYTKAEMVAFAKKFLPHCQKQRVTYRQLKEFEREQDGENNDSV